MGKMKRKWQEQLEAAQASGMSLVDYAAQRGINVRRLYEARHARARVQAAQAMHPRVMVVHVVPMRSEDVEARTAEHLPERRSAMAQVHEEQL